MQYRFPSCLSNHIVDGAKQTNWLNGCSCQNKVKRNMKQWFRMAHETEKCYCVVSRKVWVWFSTRAINRLNIGKAHKTTFELLLKVNTEEEPSSTDCAAMPPFTFTNLNVNTKCSNWSHTKGIILFKYVFHKGSQQSQSISILLEFISYRNLCGVWGCAVSLK